MLFNSLEFAIFLPVVFALYWVVKERKLQNILLLAASYFFYGSWDYRFLFLLIFSTALDYYSGIKIHETSSKKIWLWTSIIINVGFLAVFKYYNFFVGSFSDAFGVEVSTLNVILPVGISFYTFHGLSYVFDIYNGKIKPERNFVDYSLFVSFFPLLVAGPIERATHLLPQIKANRYFDYYKAKDGMRQILWGLFKKIAIADTCAKFVNPVFDSYGDQSGSTLLLGAVLFGIQIYCDFSGYSDIALGTARLFGIELLRNFNFPYFSRDMGEFWRKWHISLSSWFKDYLYKPLGGSSKWINIFIVFIVSGFWHGANWTFIVWGLLNALYSLPFIGKKRDDIPQLNQLHLILFTFFLTTIAWAFFRSATVTDAIHYLVGMFSPSLFSMPSIFPVTLFVLIAGLVTIEWRARTKQHALQDLNLPKIAQWTTYYGLVFLILYFVGKEQQFIYFQF